MAALPVLMDLSRSDHRYANDRLIAIFLPSSHDGFLGPLAGGTAWELPTELSATKREPDIRSRPPHVFAGMRNGSRSPHRITHRC